MEEMDLDDAGPFENRPVISSLDDLSLGAIVSTPDSVDSDSQDPLSLRNGEGFFDDFLKEESGTQESSPFSPILDLIRCGDSRMLELVSHQIIQRVFNLAESEGKIDQEDSFSSEFFPRNFVEEPRLASQGANLTFSITNIEPILAERLREAKGMTYLISSYMRLFELKGAFEDSNLSNDPVNSLMDELKHLLLNYAALFLCECDVFSQEESYRSVSEIIENLSSDNYRPTIFFLDSFSTERSKEEFLVASQLIFNRLSDSMKVSTLTSDSSTAPIAALQRLMMLTAYRRAFTTQKGFISSWLNNGAKVQKESPMSFFFGLTTLPDEPSVGEKYFNNPSEKPPLEVYGAMRILYKKLDKSYGYLRNVVSLIFSDPVSRSNMLSWISSLLISNWSRNRMRPARNMISQDGFFLNVCSILIKLFLKECFQSHNLIDPMIVIAPSRIDFTDEARLVACGKEVSSWREEIIQSGGVTQSEEDINSLKETMHSTHIGIICDRCRTKDIEGVRYKCGNCKDFDLCASCEKHEFCESINLSAPSKGFTFDCPLPSCESKGMSERELAQHVSTIHSELSSDYSSDCNIVCPICRANKVSPLHAVSPQAFITHLTQQHSCFHDPLSHCMVKMPRMIPHHRGLKFNIAPSFKFVDNSDSPAFSMVTATNSEDALAVFQSSVIHHGISCSNCKVSSIVGIRYCCYNCANYNLCEDCERLDAHDPSHVLWSFRRPLENFPESIEVEQPSLYPSSVIGSYGFNFQSELMFLALHSMHLGLLKTCARYTSLMHGLETESAHNSDKIESMSRIKLCVDAQLRNPSLLNNAVSFYSFVSRWMISLIDPLQSQNLLPKEIPRAYAALPEFILDDMAEFFMFLCKYGPTVVQNNEKELLFVLHLFIYVLRNPAYCRNPYTRSKLIEVFASISPVKKDRKQSCSELKHVFENDAFIIENLLLGAVELFVDIEHTGSDSQFYEKFNVRFVVARLIRYILVIPVYIENFKTKGIDSTLLLRFVNCAISDTIYLLDESFIKASSIFEIEERKSNTDEWNSMPRSRRHEETQHLHTFRRGLRTVALLASGTLSVLWMLMRYERMRSIFLGDEMIDRLAQSVNYYVTKIMGPDRKTMRIKNPSKLNFEIQRWIGMFLDFYLEHANYDRFLSAVAGDARCFKSNHILAASEYLLKHLSNSSDGVIHVESQTSDDKFRVECVWNEEKHRSIIEFVGRVSIVSDRIRQDHVDLGDIPDEFLDPILSTIMDDPVILPTSGMTMDRPVILRHLLSKPNDPFNRLPLSADSLQPNVSLKARIDEFRNESLLRRQSIVASPPPSKEL